MPSKVKLLPTVRVSNGDIEHIVNECDLPKWRKNGYEVVTEPIKPPTASGGEGEKGDGRPMVADLSGLKVPELRQRAAKLGVSNVAKLRRDELLDAIVTIEGDGVDSPGDLTAQDT
jgi:hypothetical protein